MKSKKLIIIFLFLAVLTSGAFAATITSAASGYWNDTGTWVGGTIPSSTDSVVISSGHEVLFDRNDASTTCGPITINSGGILKFKAGTETMQVKGDINVNGTLELVPGSTLKIECETSGQYGIIVYSGGELKGTGSVPTVLTTLTAPLAIGEQAITVASISGFGIGDILTLGDGANAEGFTISAISGNQITLNRKALNAQASGVEMYKNAAVITSDILADSNLIYASNLGGIIAGDKILIEGDSAGYYESEIFEVSSVDGITNSIEISGSLSYNHPINSLIIKLNRDTKITNTGTYYNQRHYIIVYDGAKINLDYTEVERVGSKNGGSIYGFTIRSSNNCYVKGSSLHHGNFGVLLEPDSVGVNIISNIAFRNNAGINLKFGAKDNNIISNLAFLNYGGGIALDGNHGGRNYILTNYVFSNESGFYLINSRNTNLFLFNKLSSNGRYNIAYGYDNLFVGNEISYALWGGIYLAGDRNVYIDNKITNNKNAGIYNLYDHENNIFLDCTFKDNVGNDIQIDARPYSPWLKMGLIIQNCEYQKAALSQIDAGFILLQNNNVLGQTELFGEYHVEPQKIIRFNYSTPSYLSSATTPFPFRGSNHTITTPETSDASTVTEVWLVTYRSATSNWEVKGTVSSLQLNRASSGVVYTSDNSQVSFTLTENSPQEGDQFVFATVAAAGDANTQKKVLFGPSAIEGLNNQSRLVIDSGGKIEIKGTADYPTLIDYDGTGGYGFVISGEVEAENFDFNQINADGVEIGSTATITKFDNGSIYNVYGLGSHLSVSAKDHTFNYLNFDSTGAYDVKTSNDANLVFMRSQRGKFLDSISDTSSISWDDPILGYTDNYAIGSLSFNSDTKVLTVPFKIKDPNSLNCTFRGGSFQYSQNGGGTWRTVSDSDLSGIGGPFASATDFTSAPEHVIYWNTATNYGNLEANLAVRFRVDNGYVYGNYGSSEAIPFNFKPPVVRVLYPNGGEFFKGGMTTTITWTATDEGSGVDDDSVAIYYTLGDDDILVANGLSNTGEYNWAVPTINTEEAKIKIVVQDNVGETGQDLSDRSFAIDSTPPEKPTVNGVRTPTFVNKQILSGTRSNDTQTILVNSSSEGVTSPTVTTWTKEVSLVKGENVFTIKALDAVGNESSPEIVVIEGADKTFTNDVLGISIFIPFGTISSEVNFEIETVASPREIMKGCVLASDIVEITSDIDAFEIPVSIVLKLKGAVSNPIPFYYDPNTKKWSRTGLEIENIETGSIRFKTSHLTVFAIFDVVDLTAPSIEAPKINGRIVANGDSINSKPGIQIDISDDYGVDASQVFLRVDGADPKSLSENEASEVGTSVSLSYTFSDDEKLSLGNHTFKITAADEVGNASTWEATLCVVADSIPGLLIYPNPYTLGDLNYVKFDGLTEDVRVRIYDIAGDLVWAGQNTAGSSSLTWDVTNSAGRQIVPGVYFYVVISDSGGKQSGKIAIIR